VLQEMLAYFAEVWKIRQKQPPKFDLISMLAHGEATRDLPCGETGVLSNTVGKRMTYRVSYEDGLAAASDARGHEGVRRTEYFRTESEARNRASCSRTAIATPSPCATVPAPF
jgi:hypothetical protein